MAGEVGPALWAGCRPQDWTVLRQNLPWASCQLRTRPAARPAEGEVDGRAVAQRSAAAIRMDATPMPLVAKAQRHSPWAALTRCRRQGHQHHRPSGSVVTSSQRHQGVPIPAGMNGQPCLAQQRTSHCVAVPADGHLPRPLRKMRMSRISCRYPRHLRRPRVPDQGWCSSVGSRRRCQYPSRHSRQPALRWRGERIPSPDVRRTPRRQRFLVRGRAATATVVAGEGGLPGPGEAEQWLLRRPPRPPLACGASAGRGRHAGPFAALHSPPVHGARRRLHR